jgi:type IV secretory pathway protease TraF
MNTNIVDHDGFLRRQMQRLKNWFRLKQLKYAQLRHYSFRRELIAIALLVLGSNLAVRRLSVTITPSIDATLLVRNNAPLKRGDYVSFILYDKRAPNGQARVMKKYLCVPGDLLERQGAAFYCNGTLLGMVHKTGSDGKPLTAMTWTRGRIPDRFAYVGSGVGDGYDSRYFGLVSLDRLQRYDKLF